MSQMTALKTYSIRLEHMVNFISGLQRDQRALETVMIAKACVSAHPVDFVQPYICY